MGTQQTALNRSHPVDVFPQGHHIVAFNRGNPFAGQTQFLRQPGEVTSHQRGEFVREHLASLTCPELWQAMPGEAI